MHAWRTAGAACARPKRGDQRSDRIEAYRAIILAAIEAQVDITPVKLAELFRREHHAAFPPSTIWRFLVRHAITTKKIAQASQQARSDVAAERRAWFNSQPDLDPARLVFIDETGASAKIARMVLDGPMNGEAFRADIEQVFGAQ
jgi:hypothetical protein